VSDDVEIGLRGSHFDVPLSDVAHDSDSLRRIRDARGSAAISLVGVTKRFDAASSPAVTDLSLEIAEGEIVALVGPSGCGKTTTLKMINRLVEPTSGSIMVLGEDQRAVPAHELRRRIGYVIQQIGLFPHRSVRRNIGVVPELLGWNSARIDARCNELADLVGLDHDLLDRYPSALSGGQQQRAGVARALAADPPILLMDEPYSAVDPIVRERLQDDLLALQAEVHKTIVIVTHDIDEAVKLADRVAIMNVGGILEQYATPDELLSAPADAFVASFLGRERGLRRLALRAVSDITPIEGPALPQDATIDQALAKMTQFGTPWVAVVDGTHLLGWVGRDVIERARTAAAARKVALGDLPRESFVSRVSPSTPLREALDVIVNARSRMAVVVDDTDLDQPAYLGMITIDEVAGGLE
jgi:osmoprotectant transport system ATP-binding protein